MGNPEVERARFAAWPSPLWKLAEFKIGDNFVPALVLTNAYAAVLAASDCAPTAIPVNKRRYVKGGRDYPVGIDKRGRLRLGDLKKSQASAISDERAAQPWRS
jgi:hypothetical protein